MNYPSRFPILDRSVPLILTSYAFVSLMELMAPLRKSTQSFLPRNAENYGIALPSFLAMRFFFMPLAYFASQCTRQKSLGLFRVLGMPAQFRRLLTFLALDYSVFIWHYLAHRLPSIWRYHTLHHSDRELTASTAVRFHYIETLLSGVFQTLALILIGAGPRTFLLHQTIFRIAVAFHHSNWRLPWRLDPWLSRFIVTPEQHGTHHSRKAQEMNSNFSTIFNVWDRLHRTLWLGVPQDGIRIGLPEEESALREASARSP